MQLINQELVARKQLMEERIQAACLRVGRHPSEVKLIAVTKYSSLQATSDILELGVQDLGESRWQEAKHKWETIGDRARWHFIGHLQTNKVKDVLGKFEWIHSLDRLSLAAEIQRKAEQMGLNVACLVQLNISGEQSKYGLHPEEVADFFQQLRNYPRVDVVGLMTMAPHGAPATEVRHVFKSLREYLTMVNLKGWSSRPLTQLSMGMSDDFEIAIEEGATMIRLGSSLMGENF